MPFPRHDRDLDKELRLDEAGKSRVLGLVFLVAELVCCHEEVLRTAVEGAYHKLECSSLACKRNRTGRICRSKGPRRRKEGRHYHVAVLAGVVGPAETARQVVHQT